MNYFYDPKEKERVAEARESFSGRLLTDAQFDESMAITGIIEREIKKSGAFKEKLGDYAYAFARTEKMDAARAETTLRDLFKARTGQSMNDMRQALAEREEKLTAGQKKAAYEYAVGVGDMIENGDKINFNRAFAHQGAAYADELGITDAGAKRLMKDAFKEAENGGELYDWGKGLEEQFYRPQIEAEKQRTQESKQENGRSRGANRSRRSESSDSSGTDGSAGSDAARDSDRSHGKEREASSSSRRSFQTPARSRMRLER